jgi:FkbM family methyltransferase
MIYNINHIAKICLSNDPAIDPYDLVKECVVHHSEPDDRLIVSTFFAGQTGKFLSIGANDGKDQTFDLLCNGWTGVYCEPDPFACAQLIETTKDFKDQVTIINCAVTPAGGTIEFYLAINNSAVSSLDSEWVRDHQPDAVVRKIIVNSLTLTDILLMFNYKFDYIQTDIEGQDIQIIETVDWSSMPTCKMICTEAGPAVLKQLCRQGGYLITDITPTNSFYCQHQFVLSK